MHSENRGVWNRTHFWCGAFDVPSLKVVEVHKYEECKALDFNSYWAFNKVVSSELSEQYFETKRWIFFYIKKDRHGVDIELQIEAENYNPTPMQVIHFEGLKSLIRKQIKIVV